MKYSQIIRKTSKNAKVYDSINATLLQKGGFIDMVMAGVYSYLPLGVRVLTKIETIIRDEMNTVGSEVLLPSLSPKTIWEQTARLNTVDILMKTSAANDQGKQKNDSEYILNPTHEEIVTPLIQKYVLSYKDLPTAVYQIQTKFRNEPRVKSGLMRGREFRMKDLYSFHRDLDDFKAYYEQVKTVYLRIFQRLGLGKDTVIALASGGSFTKEYSHEFQTICDTGEDTLYFDEKNNVYYNKEVAPAELLNTKPIPSAEIGNIFPLQDKFTKAFDFKYTNEKGELCTIYMGCYGIGSSRIMGVMVEKFHDENGIIWPKQIAPFTVCLVSLAKEEDQKKKVNEIYEKLQKAGIETLLDDRETVTPGQKFADCDLIGIPIRLVVSPRTGDKIEFKERTKKETELLSLDEIINKLIR